MTTTCSRAAKEARCWSVTGLTLVKHRKKRPAGDGMSGEQLPKDQSCSVSDRITSSYQKSRPRSLSSLPRVSCAARLYGNQESADYPLRRCGIASVESRNSL